MDRSDKLNEARKKMMRELSWLSSTELGSAVDSFDRLTKQDSSPPPDEVVNRIVANEIDMHLA